MTALRDKHNAESNSKSTHELFRKAATTIYRTTTPNTRQLWL
jgi:hypothetical protein